MSPYSVADEVERTGCTPEEAEDRTADRAEAANDRRRDDELTQEVAMHTPSGTTHLSTFYGRNQYFKRTTYPHLNQVSEEWQTPVRWKWWDAGKWMPVGGGFSDRNLKEI